MSGGSGGRARAARLREELEAENKRLRDALLQLHTMLIGDDQKPSWVIIAAKQQIEKALSREPAAKDPAV